MALLGMGDVHYNVCSSCGVLEVPWIHSGTLLRTILDYVGYIITGLHRLLTPFPIMFTFFFQTYPFQTTFFILINMHFLTSHGLLLHFFLLFFLQILCTTLTFSGTPSSGLV